MSAARANIVDGPAYREFLSRARSRSVARRPETDSVDDDPFEDEDSRFTTEAVDEDNLHDALNDHCAWREGDGLSVASDENSGDGAACTQFPHRG